MSLKITFYDGVGCIGGNKILLEDEENAIFLDFGTNFKAEGMFFDEFLEKWGRARGAVIPLNLLRGYTDPLALAFTIV